MNSVKGSMSKQLVTVKWDRPMEEASRLMEENRIRHLPVADESGGIVGILSDRDVSRFRDPKKPGSAVARDYMDAPVVTVDESLSLREAAQRMIDEKISALLVTDARKSVVGIVTSEDMLKALVSRLEAPGKLEKASYLPVVGELLREVQAAGL